MLIFRSRATLRLVDGAGLRTTRHFSVDDPENAEFGDLRRFDDDTLAPSGVWLPDHHRGLEEVIYVVAGMWEQTDGSGGRGLLAAGALQRMACGADTGYGGRNPSRIEPVRRVRLGLRPAGHDLGASVEQRCFPEAARRGRWLPVLVPAPGFGGSDAPVNPGGVTVHQDVAVYASALGSGAEVVHRFRRGFQGYLFLIRGMAHVATDADGGELGEGGAVKVIAEAKVAVRARESGADVLLVETRAPAA
jgi:quercetin 2,3-dioxygenase